MLRLLATPGQVCQSGDMITQTIWNSRQTGMQSCDCQVPFEYHGNNLLSANLSITLFRPSCLPAFKQESQRSSVIFDCQMFLIFQSSNLE